MEVLGSEAVANGIIDRPERFLHGGCITPRWPAGPEDSMVELASPSGEARLMSHHLKIIAGLAVGSSPAVGSGGHFTLSGAHRNDLQQEHSHATANAVPPQGLARRTRGWLAFRRAFRALTLGL